MANNVSNIKAGGTVARTTQISNPMDDARASAERAATEYNKMHSDLLAYKAANDELRSDNELLRAEVVRTRQRMEELKEELETQIFGLKTERDQYMRFGVQMSSQLNFIDKMFKGASETISTTIANAIKASEKAAFEVKAEDTDEH